MRKPLYLKTADNEEEAIIHLPSYGYEEDVYKLWPEAENVCNG